MKAMIISLILTTITWGQEVTRKYDSLLGNQTAIEVTEIKNGGVIEDAFYGTTLRLLIKAIGTGRDGVIVANEGYLIDDSAQTLELSQIGPVGPSVIMESDELIEYIWIPGINGLEIGESKTEKLVIGPSPYNDVTGAVGTITFTVSVKLIKESVKKLQYEDFKVEKNIQY